MSRIFTTLAVVAGLTLFSVGVASAQVDYSPQLMPVADNQPVPPSLAAPQITPDCGCNAPAVATPTYSPVVAYQPVAPVYRPLVPYRPVATYRPVVAYNPVVPAYGPVVYARPAVVKTKVYYPGQPVRNFVRAITP